MEQYHSRKTCPTVFYFGVVSLIIVSLMFPHLVTTSNNTSSSPPSLGASHLAKINFIPKESTIEMHNFTTLSYVLIFDTAILKAYDSDQESQIDSVLVMLLPITKSPQFDIINIEQKDGHAGSIRLSLDQIKNNNTYTGSIIIRASYIGHAMVKAQINLFYRNGTISVPDELADTSDITVIRSDGKLELIFKVSVITLVMITYMGLGSQIERDRVTKLMESPILPIIAFIITVTIMPMVSWVLAYMIVGDQLYYRFGAFVFSCCPMPSAATMWVTMFKADKELSITLQLVSTVAALFIMPIWMFTLGVTLTQGQYDIKVPYYYLIRTLISLLVVLIIGSVIGNYRPNFSSYVKKILRPLTFAVLIFIIVFSSYVYWYIYKMFDWRVILLGFAISCCTCLICGLLGYLYRRDYDHVVTIAIGSTYKSSGVAFSVLLVALPSPDTYIAFVPCLTQVLATSTMLYIILMIKYCFVYLTRSRKGYNQGKSLKTAKSFEERIVEEKLPVEICK